MFRDKFFGGGYAGKGKSFIEEQAMAEYAKQYTDQDCVHAMCEDYRAAAMIDLFEARKDKEIGKKIQCPVMVLWGKNGVIRVSFDALREWRAVSTGEVTGEAVESSHYIPEQAPDSLLRHIHQFFGIIRA